MKPRPTQDTRGDGRRRWWPRQAAGLLLIAVWLALPPTAAQFLPPPSGLPPIVDSPHFKAIPSSLDFGVVATGTNKRLELAIQNNGVGILELQNWAASPGFAVGQAPGLTHLDTGQSTVMYVDFSPTTAGAASGALTFNTSAGVATVPLSGQGEVQARADVSPPFTFFDTLVGERKTTSVFVRNGGTGTLVVRSWAVSGAGLFVTEAPSERRLGSGELMSLELVFQPTSRGLVNGTVYFSTNAGEASTPVSGRGVAPVVEVTPTLLDFGDVVIGQTSKKVLSFKNIGDAPLIELGYGSVGYAGFEIKPPSLEYPNNRFNPGESFLVIVSYTPQTVGTHSRTLSWYTNAGDATVRLTGTGISPISITPSSIDFGQVPVGQRSAKELTIKNLGAAAVTFNFAAINPPFTVLKVPPSLEPGQSFVTKVEFAPETTGRHTEICDFRSTAGSHKVELIGMGIEATSPSSPPAPPPSPPSSTPNPSPGGTIPGGTTPGVTNPGNMPPADTTRGRVGADWPVFMQGPTQSGRAEVALDPRSLTPWSVPLGSRPGGPPVVLGGVAYIGTEANGVFAIDLATRRQRWNHALGAAIRSAPAAGADVIVVSVGGLLGLHPADGRTLWQRPDIAAPDGVSPMRTGETLVIGGRGPAGLGHAMYAVKAATGTNAWPAPALLPLPALSTAAIDADRGVMFVAVGQLPAPGQPATGPSAVMALRLADGGLAWPAPTVLLHAAPAALSVGRVATSVGSVPALFVAAGATVTALNGVSGTPLWTRTLPETGLQAPPVVSTAAAGATLLVGSASGRVYALAADTGADAPGGLANGVAPITGTMALAGSTLFVPTEAGLLAVEARTGTRLWTGEGEPVAGVAVSGEGLVAGTRDGRLAGFSGTGTPVAPTPEPAAGADLAVVQIQVQPQVFRTAGAQVRVVLANRGSAPTPYRLRLKVEPGGVLVGEKEGNLGAGVTDAVVFNWPASLMVEGSATLVAEVEVPGQTDSQPRDNAARATVTVRQ